MSIRASSYIDRTRERDRRIYQVSGAGGSQMAEQYTFIQDIADLAPEIPKDTIISRTFHEDDRMKVILFGFAEGQELSEHTASQPAMLLFLGGETDLKLGEDEHKARTGTWVHMPARLPHSIMAKTQTLMLLFLYKEVD